MTIEHCVRPFIIARKLIESSFFLHQFVFNSVGKPLYSDESEFDDEKFGDVMRRVLFPMALDYHVRSREVDVNALAAGELSNLNGDMTQKDEATQVWLSLGPGF